jgi:hypothetical protein
MYGALYLAGAAVGAMAISIVFLGSLTSQGAALDRRTADILNDLGNLLLAFVMIWAYFSFSQFLWSGNLPEENVWYVARSRDGWQYVAVALAALHFAAPFLLLLSRDIKRNPRMIAAVAGGLIAMRAIDLLWIVAPSFEREHGWGDVIMDFAVLAGVGCVWVAVFCWALKAPVVHASGHHDKHGKRKGGGS